MIGRRTCTRETHNLAASAINAVLPPNNSAVWRMYTAELLQRHIDTSRDRDAIRRGTETLAALKRGEVSL